MSIFDKVLKKQEKADAEAQQREAEVRAAKFSVFYAEFLKLAVAHDMTIGNMKMLLNQLNMELGNAFDSRMVADFQDKAEAPAEGEEVAAEPVVESEPVAEPEVVVADAPVTADTVLAEPAVEEPKSE